MAGHYWKAFFAQQLNRYPETFFPQKLRNIKIAVRYRKAFFAQQLDRYRKNLLYTAFGNQAHTHTDTNPYTQCTHAHMHSGTQTLHLK